MLTVERELPVYLVRDTDSVVTLTVRGDGVIRPITQAGSKVSVFDDNNEAVVDAQDVTVDAGGVASFTVLAATLPSDTYSWSNRWRVEWSAIVDTKTKVIREDAHLVTFEPFMTLTETRLRGLHSDLARMFPPGVTNHDQWKVPAFTEILTLLLDVGRPPTKLISSWSLRRPHEKLTLHYRFRDLSTFAAGTGRYAELANDYEKEFNAAWDKLRLDKFDYSDDGRITDSEGIGVSAHPAVFLSQAADGGF